MLEGCWWGENVWKDVRVDCQTSMPSFWRMMLWLLTVSCVFLLLTIGESVKAIERWYEVEANIADF